MFTKFIQSDKFKVNFSFLAVLIFVYIILFEFILPVNKFLPKPSMLVESISSLIYDYNLINGFIFTFTAIYIFMLLSYLLIYLSKSILIYTAQNFQNLSEIFLLGKYFVPLFIILLFDLWFSDSIWGEYLFMLILMMAPLKIEMIKAIKSVKEEYLISGKSLGLNKKEINDKIVWKSIQPKVYDVIIQNHIYFWVYILVYEFICNTQGLGSIFNLIVKYNDLSALIIVFIILILSMVIMEIMLNRVKKKFFFWDC